MALVGGGEKLIGSKSIFFSSPGEYTLYRLSFSNEDKEINTESKKKITIVGAENWLTLEQNNRIFSLTLIIIALTLISLSKPNRKSNII